LASRPSTEPILRASERPAERLFTRGAQALSDAELLALLIGSGCAGATALRLAQVALAELGGLAGVLRASRRQFEAITGLGARPHARAQVVLEIRCSGAR
jgi:DNA repair protein RadC